VSGKDEVEFIGLGNKMGFQSVRVKARLIVKSMVYVLMFIISFASHQSRALALNDGPWS
jgi:hypothetical protein